jgi:hypothetical protein
MMHPSVGATLLKHWRSRPAIALMPPVTADEIKEFARKHQVQLPEEIREYYLSVNGFGPADDQDENGFSFWPLARVCPVNAFESGKWSSDETHDCFIFADYLSYSWGYAFRLASDSVQAPVCIVGTATRVPRWIAASFRAFAELYIRDDERLYSANVPDV